MIYINPPLPLPTRREGLLGELINMRNLIPYFSFLFFLMTFTGFAQYAPVSTIGNVSAGTSTATVPITAINFNNIANCDLEITYDPSVAMATSVTKGPSLGGIINSNVSVPGQILISWFTFPGITLPDSTLIFKLGFSQVASGSSAINWFDNGYTCEWGDGNYNDLIDVPASTYYINGSVTFTGTNGPHTLLPDLSACSGALVDVPVRVTGFVNIGKVTLTMQFNDSNLGLASWENVSGFPGLSVSSSLPGTIDISGIVPAGGPGFSMPDSTVLVNLHFSHPGGSTALTWFDDGSSCEYTGPPPSYPVLNDFPQNAFYYNGSVTGFQPPSILTQPSSPDTVVAGTGSASFFVVAEGWQLGFQWQEFIDSWNDISNGGVYNGADSSVLTISHPPLTMNGYRYRCVVNGFCLPEAITDGIAALAVTPADGINDPASEIQGLTVYPNPVTTESHVSFSVPAGAELTLTLMTMSGKTIFSKSEKTNHEGTYAMVFPYNITGKGIFIFSFILRHHGGMFTNHLKIVCTK